MRSLTILTLLATLLLPLPALADPAPRDPDLTALVAEVRALRSEVASLRAAQPAQPAPRGRAHAAARMALLTTRFPAIGAFGVPFLGASFSGGGSVSSAGMPDPYTPPDGTWNVTGDIRLGTGKIFEIQDSAVSIREEGSANEMTFRANGGKWNFFDGTQIVGFIQDIGTTANASFAKINNAETDYTVAAVTATDTTPVDVTGISFAMDASDTYAIECAGRVDSALSTAGAQLGLDIPAGATVSAGCTASSGGTSIESTTFGSDDAACAMTNTNAASDGALYFLSATVAMAGTAGDTKLRLRSETTDDVSVTMGFRCTATKIVDL